MRNGRIECGFKANGIGGRDGLTKGLARCVAYIAAWGILCFPLGRWFKALHLKWDRHPFACRAWERDGAVYEKLGVRAWKDLAPDVSKAFPKIVPKKALTGRFDADVVRDMLEETCVAELTHWLLCLTGLALLPLWPGAGGAAVYLVYVILGNVPFIIIQRYNRPRFGRLLTAMERRERRLANASTDTVQQ